MAQHLSYYQFDQDQPIACGCGEQVIPRDNIEPYSALLDELPELDGAGFRNLRTVSTT